MVPIFAGSLVSRCFENGYKAVKLVLGHVTGMFSPISFSYKAIGVLASSGFLGKIGEP